MLKFMNSCELFIGIRIIHDGSSLKIFYINMFPFEPKRSPFELSIFIVKKFIQISCIDNSAVFGDVISN